ncbi:M23 family metallopeptidase [Archangium gephyra]|nr:M23 family metallopeptidase [Archangium gephyra]
MKTRMMLWASAALLAACGEEMAVDPASQTLVRDEVIGVSLPLPARWSVMRDEVLFDTHGVFLNAPTSDEGVAQTGHERDAVARIALAYKARPDQLEELVRTKMAEYQEFHPTRTEVTLADGRTGIAITGLPGTQPYSIVYTVDGERVYEIGLWSDEPGLDERAKQVLGGLRFQAPTKTVQSLGLKTAQESTYAELSAEREQAAADRKALVMKAILAGDLPQQQRFEDPPVRAMSCGFTAPSSLYWQLQWDGTNRFYSGAYYDMKNNPGWSAMSGNGGSWWGTGYHTRFCDANYANQHYANDWPAQVGANAYAAFGGIVEWTGWGTDGFATLGRYVVVRNNGYRSLTAHLSSIAGGMAWGTEIDGYYKVIGEAGSSGGDWAPHLHARVSYGESKTANGQPYGGETVKPLRLRCFNCNNPDVSVASGGGYYNDFSHGRWMMY